jgi:hypothetical protein
MKTKTSELIEKMLKEELNQQIPVQGNTTQPSQPQQQSQTLPQQPQQSTPSNPDEQEEVEQKVEVYIPLHDGRFTNRIFSTNKNILLKVLDDSLETDIDTLMELENNPSMYNQISV